MLCNDKYPKNYNIAKFMDQKSEDCIENGLRKKIKTALYDMDEAITWSFMDSEKAKFFGNIENLQLENPIIKSLDVLRPTLISNLLDGILENFNHGSERFAVYEYGQIYNDLNQQNVVCGLFSGNAKKASVHERERKFDVYDAKQKVENILDIFGLNIYNLRFEKPSDLLYNKAKSLKLLLGKNCVAEFGALNKNFVKKFYNLTDEVFFFQIFLDNLENIRQKNEFFHEYSKFLAIKRDCSFIIEEHQDSIDLIKIIKKSDNLIQKVEIFDIFVSEDMKSMKKKSISFRIFILPKYENLNDQQIDSIFRNAIEKVCGKFNAILRDGIDS